MRIGGLCFGYGGLDLAVSETLGAELAWYSEIDPGACKVAAHRFPGVPNVGDMTTVDWTQVEPVDVFTAGFPCQPVSGAGQRQGVNDKRWLFDDIVRALGLLRPQPRLCVFENVLGLLSANGGDAMARVVQGLASVGYVGSWRTVRASDVGAPHRRERVFIAAHPGGEHCGQRWQPAPRQAPPGRALSEPAGRDGVAADGAVALLPTPAVNDMGASYTPDEWDAWTARMRAEHDNGNGHGKSLSIEAQRLLPTPRSTDVAHIHVSERAKALYSSGPMIADVIDANNWGAYAAAIARWETVLGRPAPPPTQPSRKGTPQLSARFSEWLMGLPDGWVTDVPGITRNEALRALGNGVVPQQATAALRYLLAHLAATGAAS